MPQPYHRVGFAAAILETPRINQLRFAEAQKVLDEGSRLIDLTGREALAGGQVLLVAQVTRTAHTFEAVLMNCTIGRGVQASMLNRSLFEDALDIHWVADNPDLAPDYAEQHDRFMALAEHKRETDLGRTERPLDEDEEAELAELIDLFGGTRRAFMASWTRSSRADRMALMQERWHSETEAHPMLDYLYRVVQQQNNLMLHSSPTAFRQTIVDRPDGGRTLNRAGPDLRWRVALSHGCGAFYLSCRVLSEVFELDKEPMAAAFSQATNFLIAAAELEGLADLPADAACPCGSGFAVGDCHRSQ